jgi:protease I
MAARDSFNVAILATDGFEESELTEPAKALGQAGGKVDIISLHEEQYNALMLPGGALNADVMRADPRIQQFIRAMAQANKPMAVICHAPWELISAGVARGRTLTSYYTIQDDIRNAGANWVNQEAVVDGNLVTSRQPSDLPAFNREMLRLFSLKPQAAMR